MHLNHTFKATVVWTLKEGESTSKPRTFSRNHSVHISDSKPDLSVSAAKAFRGDDSCYNPEDLLLSALVSCHMMSYLYVCAQNGIEVIHYTDNAEAFLKVNPSGSGFFNRAILKPLVTITEASKKDLAIQLHEKAHHLCFIANSCNFPIEIQPEIVVNTL
ncbi:osmotically inducible protein OsmC [Bizionia saleffrena]|uniref:Osmotically inducible protein OsmC n=1 Tax=Bizionia saleffrena TaxID=291189 RepID=A0A8H2LFV2_9FLAO|nr:OsmC family protein [Bizionia saleffrena]TYB80310.1 osmotically inducible protein OsmC [Bizionia saleffrena]